MENTIGDDAIEGDGSTNNYTIQVDVPQYK